MAYTPTNWKDRVVEKPRTYRMQDNGDGTITLIPEPGTIYEPGTPVNAANLNKLENGLQAAAAVADSAMPKSGGQFTGRVRTAASAGNIGDPGSTGTIFEVVSGSTNDDAFMTFHVPDNIAFKFGIDRATKRLAVGGWTLGANKYKIWDERDLRINNGNFEYYDGSGWKPVGFDPRTMTYNHIAHAVRDVGVDPNSYVDVVSISGKGVLAELKAYVYPSSIAYYFGVSLVVDGVEKQYFQSVSQEAMSVFYTGGFSLGGTGSPSVFHLSHYIPFNSSLKVRIRNTNSSSGASIVASVVGGYYT